MTLIDKAALLNTIATEVHYDSERPLEMYAKLLSVVNDAPTVDAVEVVRCKDCKQFVQTNAILDGECPKLQLFVNKDYYCCWGERREG